MAAIWYSAGCNQVTVLWLRLWLCRRLWLWLCNQLWLCVHGEDSAGRGQSDRAPGVSCSPLRCFPQSRCEAVDAPVRACGCVWVRVGGSSLLLCSLFASGRAVCSPVLGRR